MEDFFDEIENIFYDIDILDKNLYIKLYSILYKNLVDMNKINTPETNIQYFNRIIHINDKTNEIFFNIISNYNDNISNLNEYYNNFFEFNSIINKINNIYEYYNKQVNEYNNIFKSNYSCFNNMAIKLWFEIIMDDENITNFVNEICSEINNYRNNFFYKNNLIDLDYIKNFIDHINNKHIPKNNNFFKIVNILEEKLNTNTFFINIIEKNNYDVNILDKIIKCEENVNNIINIDTKLHVFIETIINDYFSSLYRVTINSEIDTTLNNNIFNENNIDKFSNLYNFLNKQKKIDLIYNIYENYLLITKNKIFTTISSEKEILDIINFYKINISLITMSFESSIKFFNILEETIKTIINKTKYISLNYFSIFNKMFFKKNLDEIYIKIIKLIDNSEEFQIKFLSSIKKYILYHVNNIKDDFLVNLKKVNDNIRNFENIDISFKIDKIIKDLEFSSNYKNMLNTKNNLLILTNGIWEFEENLYTQKFNQNNIINKIPNDLLSFNENIKNLYDQIYERRKIHFCYKYYTSEIDFTINNNVYKIIAPFDITNILLYFNDNDKLTENIIKNENISKICLDLLEEKKLLNKIDNDYFLNNKFNSNTKKINLVINTKPKKKNTINKKKNIYDHDDLIKCYIMKNLKNDSLDENQLFLLVQKNLICKFEVVKPEYEKNLNKLLEMEYIIQRENLYYYN